MEKIPKFNTFKPNFLGEIKRINLIVLKYVSLLVFIAFFALFIFDLTYGNGLSSSTLRILIFAHLSLWLPHLTIFVLMKFFKLHYYSLFYFSIVSAIIGGTIITLLDIIFRNSIETYAILILSFNAIYLFKPLYSIMVSLLLYCIIGILVLFLEKDFMKIFPVLSNAFAVTVIGILINISKYNPIKRAYIRKIENLKMKHELEVKNKIIRKNYEKIIKEEKLKDEMFSQIAHELNTPITVLLGTIYKLKKDSNFLQKYKKQLDILYRNIDRLRENVDKLFSVIKIEFKYNEILKRNETIYMEQFFQELLSDYQDLINSKNINIEVKNKCDKLNNIRQLDLKIIFENLLENSIKFSPPNSTIFINTLIKENYCYLIITDEGMGIPEKEQEHIFEKFYQVNKDKKYKGMGLGLYIVKKIVDSYNGTIKVDSIPGKGTTFTIIFSFMEGDGVSVSSVAE